MTTTDDDPGAAGFTGFPDEALAFFAGLEADNTRTYWAAHRDVYERAVRAPMLALLAALEPEFGPGKLFRPYRDVRFSADKSPYKTHAGAVLHHTDGEGTLYVQLSADGLVTGSGCYQMLRDQVARYRAAVDDDASGAVLEAVVAALLEGGHTLAGETLVRVPPGWARDHPRADLLRRRGIAAVREHPDDDWLATPEAARVVARDWRAGGPLREWLATHVGPGEGVDADGRPVRSARRVSPAG